MSSSKTATVVIGDQVFSRDGRRRRRETNRNRVVEATAKLIREGNPTPTAGDVAEQAEVSERSIFRYFDDVDALLQAAIESEVDDALTSELTVPGPPVPTAERLSLFVAQRAALYVRLEAVIRSIRTRMAAAPTVETSWTRVAEHLRAQTTALLSHEKAHAERDGGRLADLVDALSSIDAYLHLSSLRGHHEAVATIEIGLAKLLEPA